MIAPDLDLLSGLRPCRHCPTCRHRRDAQVLACGYRVEDCTLHSAGDTAVDAWVTAHRPYLLHEGHPVLHYHSDIAPGAPDCPGWESA